MKRRTASVRAPRPFPAYKARSSNLWSCAMSSLSSLAILGCGNMAQAILQGVLRAGLLPAERVTITNIDTAARDEVQ